MKLRLKKKNCAIALIIVLLLVFEIINPIKLYSSYSIQKLNYSKESSLKIIEYGLKKDVLDNEYNKFIDVFVNDKNFIVDNYEIYKGINYLEDFKNIALINKLINKEYKVDSINCILNTGEPDSIEKFLEKDKYEDEDIIAFLNFDYANLDNLDRYMDYQKKNISDYEETVLYVEIGLDNEFYTNYNVINEFSYDMLVNKYNQLSKDYVPENIVNVDSKYSTTKNNSGNKVMLENFYKMADELNKETGLKIYIRSGYRSYESQEDVYNDYLSLYGKNYVKKYVAYPGFSEHQTGLSIDIKASTSETFANTKESKWLKENAYKYGFILRYAKNKEDITGYQNEEWHYRYVGVDIATDMHENKMSFDEYYVKYLSK